MTEKTTSGKAVQKNGRNIGGLLLIGPPLLYLFIFLVIPYGEIVVYSFWKADIYVILREFTFENYARVIDNPLYRQVIWNSLSTAGLVTLFSLLVGYPLAFYLAFVARRHRQLLYFLIVIPLLTSFLLRAYTWKIILGRSGLINSALQSLGLTDASLDIFLYNQFSVILTLVYIFVPFVALPIYASLEKLSRDQIEASLDLGARPLTTFRRVILPLSMPGVVAGCTFAFALSFGDFVAPSLLGGPNQIMITNVIISQFGTAFDWPFGSALAIVVLLVVLGIIAIGSRIERR
jgi:spermidine/putrescine transport system permease protein